MCPDGLTRQSRTRSEALTAGICEWQPWSDWAPPCPGLVCLQTENETQTCPDGVTVQTRTRSEQNVGGTCQWQAWSDWSPACPVTCTAVETEEQTCSDGATTQTRSRSQTNVGGTCQWEAWSDWTPTCPDPVTYSTGTVYEVYEEHDPSPYTEHGVYWRISQTKHLFHVVGLNGESYVGLGIPGAPYFFFPWTFAVDPWVTGRAHSTVSVRMRACGTNGTEFSLPLPGGQWEPWGWRSCIPPSSARAFTPPTCPDGSPAPSTSACQGTATCAFPTHHQVMQGRQCGGAYQWRTRLRHKTTSCAWGSWSNWYVNGYGCSAPFNPPTEQLW